DLNLGNPDQQPLLLSKQAIVADQRQDHTQNNRQCFTEKGGPNVAAVSDLRVGPHGAHAQLRATAAVWHCAGCEDHFAREGTAAFQFRTTFNWVATNCFSLSIINRCPSRETSYSGR